MLEYWDLISKDLQLPPISERQLSDRLKKSAITLENQQRSFFKCFLSWSGDRVISADKMMNHAKGPVWHKKQKGSFTLASHNAPVLGCFLWMKNSANEAKRLWLETAHYEDLIDYVAMDSKVDDYDLYRELKRQRRISRVTSNGKRKITSEHRRQMHQTMKQPKQRQIYKERAYRVEPMQGLVKV